MYFVLKLWLPEISIISDGRRRKVPAEWHDMPKSRTNEHASGSYFARRPKTHRMFNTYQFGAQTVRLTVLRDGMIYVEEGDLNDWKFRSDCSWFAKERAMLNGSMLRRASLVQASGRLRGRPHGRGQFLNFLPNTYKRKHVKIFST